MIEWLKRKFGSRKAKKMEKDAAKSEARVEALEERGAAQEVQLDKATERVTKAVGAVKRIETLGTAYQRAEEERLRNA